MDVQTVSTFFALLTVTANVAVITAIGLAIAARFSKRADSGLDRLRESLADSALPLAFVVALTATLGSLYLSEVAHFIPCPLCWYQRICMYPLTLLIAIAWFRRDFAVKYSVIPLAAIGATISIYHYQLERFPDQGNSFCSAAAPCTLVWIWKFHYISIPFMALSAFALIITLMLLAPRASDEAEGEIVDDGMLTDGDD